MCGWGQRVEVRGLVPLERFVLELLQLGGSSLLDLSIGSLVHAFKSPLDLDRSMTKSRPEDG